MSNTLALTRLGATDLEELSRRAASTPRQRLNRNLHACLDEPVHRLLNAVEPGTYVRPHRHLTPPKTETMVVLAGSLGLVTFDDGGATLETVVLSPGGGTRVVEVPPGVWHTLVSLEEGTVFFEVKGGPYVAPAGDDAASWAPPEGVEAARLLLEAWRRLFG